VIELAVICGLLVALNAWQQVDRRLERQEVRAERADLLQRISAPEHAAIQHYNDHVENHSPPAVNPDIDEDYYVSKDDLAEQLARAEVTGGD
jgi:hypothetical protein